MRENAEPIQILETDYRKLVEPYKEEAYEELKKLVSINSVLDLNTKSETMPFGQGVENALSYVAQLGKRLGFTVNRCDNYVTELTYGEGDKILDIYGHCDVVPVDEKKWTYNPFSLTLIDGNIMYGRGTSDDKGPALSCLYALKALIDNKKIYGHKVRFLFGGNEENDSLCLKHYFEEMHKEYPTLGISPDADYPLIYAEKSIYAYKATYKVKIQGVKDFSLGSALNIVLAEAECDLTIEKEKVEEHLKQYLTTHKEVKAEYKENHLKFIGKPYHGSMPYNGVNALLHMLNFLGYLTNNELLNKIFKDYNDGMGNNFDGNFKDEYFSETTYNVGRASYQNDELSLFINLRFPAGLKVNDVLFNVENKTHASISLLGGSEGFMMDPNSDFVKILLNSYQKETGDYTSKPLAIGGGTYARESKNSVAFGAQFVNRDYRMHGNDEFFPLSDFFDNMQIYAHALNDLSVYLRTGKIS